MHESTLTRPVHRRVPKQHAAPAENNPPSPASTAPVDRTPALTHIACKVGIAAITENMLKRKWSATILRHIDNGLHAPARIARIEQGISPKVMNERLRTMHRYALVQRCPMPDGNIEYTITSRGKKILDILNAIDRAERHTG